MRAGNNFKHTTVRILTPKDYAAFGRHNIKSGSALVSVSTDIGTRIYYEGNVYGACNLDNMSERIYTAAGRAMTAYPTISFLYLDDTSAESDFDIVGHVELINQRMAITVTNEEKLFDWAGTYKSNIPA